jgi:hypothetical protein
LPNIGIKSHQKIEANEDRLKDCDIITIRGAANTAYNYAKPMDLNSSSIH